MKFEEIYKLYQSLKDNLQKRREAIMKKNLEQINKLDEDLVIIAEKLKTLRNIKASFNEEEKEKLNALIEDVKKLEENNEILINYSLNVINNTLSGILNIIQKDKKSYNSKGQNCQNDNNEAISSIIEEA